MPPRWRFSSSAHLRRMRLETTLIRQLSLARTIHVTHTQFANVSPLRKELKAASKQARLDAFANGRAPTLADAIKPGWELTVGIEIHAQLNTIRKLFSRARPRTDDAPNTGIAPFDIALPGSQPQFQLSTIVPALRAALALNCTIQPVSTFDRKHYFYHDQPAGYQITQYHRPFARDGSILLTMDDGLPASDGDELVVGIKQIQMEQDTAKTSEQEDGTSLIDFTRSGQPLIEIISLPNIHSPQAASAYLRKIQAILLSTDSVTTGMELGGLRADVNVSVRQIHGPAGTHSYSGVHGLGQRTEIKNLSSFKAVEDAVTAERDRQIALLEAGGQIEGETRGWSLAHPGETRRLRGKEGEVDYRYMPDPDIAPLHIGDDLVAHLKKTLPPMPEQLVAMLVERYGLSSVDAKALVVLDHGKRLLYFQDVAGLLAGNSNSDRLVIGKMTGNWVLHELGALLSTSEKPWTPDLVPASSLAQIIRLQNAGKITSPSAKKLLRLVFDNDRASVDEIVTRENLWFESLSSDELRNLASRIIHLHADTVAAIRKGSHNKIQFLLGQMMKTEDRNRIDAKQAGQLLRSMILEE